jgi:hypothetical protein
LHLEEVLWNMVSEKLKTRRRSLWIGFVVIFIYWTSIWWLPLIVVTAGVHPEAGGDPSQVPGLTRTLEIYHWPHMVAMRILGPLLQPRDAFFPPAWVLLLTQVIPMLVSGAICWLILRTMINRQEVQWKASS